MSTKFVGSCLFILIVTLSVITVLSGCKKDIPRADQAYDLDVKLTGVGKSVNTSGFLKFRQDPDTARIVDLDTWIYGLSPDHAYQLQRAVNPISDSTGCSSTAWLTLGLGLAPMSIHTDLHGDGHADLWRAVTSIARGTEFHIHFQIVDSLTSETVLVSDCYNYTVR